MALSQREQQILAELEAQLTHSRGRLKAVLHRAWWLRAALQPAALVVGLALIVLSIFVWWPMAIMGYACAAFGAVGVLEASRARALSWFDRRLGSLRERRQAAEE